MSSINTNISINIGRLREFVSALKAVTFNNPRLETINMRSIGPPECGTPGCHAGAAMLALDLIGVPYPSPIEDPPDRYDFEAEAARLSNFLFEGDSPWWIAQGEPSETKLQVWAEQNPEIWGAENGYYMFSSPGAFGLPLLEREFPISILVGWWGKVLERLSPPSEEPPEVLRGV